MMKACKKQKNKYKNHRLTRLVLPPTHIHTAEVRVSGKYQFCSTWGNYHFRTFDGDFFQLPSTCSYVLAKHSGEVYDAFNIQVKREEVGGVPTFKKATLTLDGTLVELADSFVSVNNKV